ncbi:DUF4861 family protein [Leeuwenhoekiella sp. NPDC079379]|uniref:DUF4861 family protein n=1 Tax=Leeuwenhoekiella sp. NPDC079379 TaxID=3364122 RepID=UPI0037C63979
MHYSKNAFLATTLLALSSCGVKNSALQVIVTNTLNEDRSYETVSVDLDRLTTFNRRDTTTTIAVIQTKSKDTLMSQLVDEDGDGVADVVIFQPEIAAKSTNTYNLTSSYKKPDTSTTDPAVYSRFVPERTDDYAWENNKVAFRTYGPVAQKMIEDKIPGGTLSSGIDAWLKRVDYPIINKWYKKMTSGAGTYHEDTGEGLDNFHVGASRGIGGIAVKKDSTYYYSKNFTTWKTLTTGPLRTSFILEYEDWDANGTQITEQKKISLDYGSNFSKFEITITGADTVSAGLTLHSNTGKTSVNEENKWISYWEHIDDSDLGSALIIPQGLQATEKYLTPKQDESNLYAHINVENNKVIYYAGFGWKKSGQFTNEQEWLTFLNTTSEKLSNPLQVSFSK